MVLYSHQHKPTLNQTVYITRPKWNKWLIAKFTDKGFETRIREYSFVIGITELEYSSSKQLRLYWTDDPHLFLAQ